MTGKGRSYLATGTLIAGLAAGMLIGGNNRTFHHTDSSGQESSIAYAQAQSYGLPEYERAVISATHNALPAVVSISVYGTRTYVIRDPLMQMLYGGRIRRQQVSGMGSGVIIDPKGIIITNDHVVTIARETRGSLQVTLTDGRTFDAEIVKALPMQDIAVLRISGEDLPFLKFGKSSEIMQGQTAIAIGNPFGSNLTDGLAGGEPTVTRGVISATKRSLTMANQNYERYYRNMLQTDASINEGNSGGALIDLEGNLIGINTAIYTAGGTGSIGIGFAIPSDRVILILDQINQYGDIQETFSGIMVDEVTQSIRQALDLGNLGGAIVTSLGKGSPGEEAGFKRGDVITAVNGLIVTSFKETNNMFRGAIPGEVYTLTVFRDGSFEELDLTLGMKQ